MKRSGIRKTAKAKTMGWWKKEFWTVFSLFIRTRDNFQCFTCDNRADGKGMHAGHFIPRASGGLSLYFHEQNVHAQCYRCNMNLGGNGAEYYKRMVTKYGQELVDELFYLRDNGFKKFSIPEYQELIEVYKKKISELKT
jgi:hypothetical protein